MAPTAKLADCPGGTNNHGGDWLSIMGGSTKPEVKKKGREGEESREGGASKSLLSAVFSILSHFGHCEWQADITDINDFVSFLQVLVATHT